MTCIAAIAEDGKVWMGGDTAAMSGWDLNIIKDSKVANKDNILIGSSGDCRTGNLLSHVFQPPVRDANQTVEQYLAGPFVDGIRDLIRDHRTEYKDGCNSVLLVGLEGRVFMFDSVLSFVEPVCGYTSIGCGSDLAKGSLFTTEVAKSLTPKERLTIALTAAATHSAGVNGPFTYVSTEDILEPVAALKPKRWWQRG